MCQTRLHTEGVGEVEPSRTPDEGGKGRSVHESQEHKYTGEASPSFVSELRAARSRKRYLGFALLPDWLVDNILLLDHFRFIAERTV